MTVEQQQQEALPFPFPPPPELWKFPPQFAQLRTDAPVARVRLPNGVEAWLVTRNAEVRQVLVDQRFSRALAASSEISRLAPNKILNTSLIGIDPPDHTRLRTLVNRGFTARRVELLRPKVVANVARLLDEMESGPRPADLVEGLSMPLPFLVICELLGVPPEDQAPFLRWSEDIVGGRAIGPERVTQAYESLIDYLDGLVNAKREEPGEDMLSALIVARDENDRLSHRELVELAALLLVSGHETTATLLSMFVLHLMHTREHWDRLLAEPHLLDNAVEELLRTVRRSDIGGGFPRIVTEDLTLGGVPLKAGDAVIPAFDAAARDPEIWSDPEEFKFDRRENPHLAFGGGIHYCLGAPLARIELQESLRALLERFPGLHIAVPEEELKLKTHVNMRSLQHLPVTW